MGTRQRRWIDVDADKLARQLDRRIPKVGLGNLRPDGQNDIRIAHDLLDFGVRHPRTEAKRMIGAHDALGGDSREDRGAQPFGNGRRAGARRLSAAAEDDQRILGCSHNPGRLLALLDIGNRTARKHPRGPTAAGRLLEQIERQFKIGWPRPCAGECRQCLGDAVAHIRRRKGCHVQLDDARRGFALLSHLVKAASTLCAVEDVEC